MNTAPSIYDEMCAEAAALEHHPTRRVEPARVRAWADRVRALEAQGEADGDLEKVLRYFEDDHLHLTAGPGTETRRAECPGEGKCWKADALARIRAHLNRCRGVS